MILEEIKNIKESKKDLRKFGLTIGIALIVIAAVLIITRKHSSLYFAGVGFIIAVIGIIVPQILKPLNKVWMSLSIILGWIMTRVILIFLFYLAITPIGLLTKLLRKDFLDMNIDKAKGSYWLKRELKKFEPKDYERQF